MTPFTHSDRASHFVREQFRQRKIEKDPRLIELYVYHAEQFVAQWERPEPYPKDRRGRGSILYQRNAPFHPQYLDEKNHVDFEAMNKYESESDYYIARYRQMQFEEENKKFSK